MILESFKASTRDLLQQPSLAFSISIVLTSFGVPSPRRLANVGGVTIFQHVHAAFKVQFPVKFF